MNDDVLLTREQIGSALEYSNPRVSITNMHNKHKDRLDKFSTITKVITVEGSRNVERETVLYTTKGVMEICRWSQQKKAMLQNNNPSSLSNYPNRYANVQKHVNYYRKKHTSKAL